MLSGVVVGLLRGLVGELGDVVGPVRVLRRRALFVDRLDSVSDLCTGVRADGPLDDPLVVVDEQPGRGERLLLLPHLVELERGSDRVRRAAAQVALVVDRWALLPEIDLRREGGRDLRRRAVQEISAVGQVRIPAVALDLAGHLLTPYAWTVESAVESAAASTVTPRARTGQLASAQIRRSRSGVGA